MLRWLLLLLLIPFFDAVLLAIFVERVDVVGWVEMVLVVVLTGLVGLLLVRAEGRRTLRKITNQLETGQVPTNPLIDGALLIAAGAFLLTPGLVTDGLGFLLVLPLTRYPIRTGLKRFVLIPYLDSKADGLVSGAVWTEGFPAEGTADPRDRDADTRATRGTIDVEAESYTVDLGDVRERHSDDEEDPGYR